MMTWYYEKIGDHVHVRVFCCDMEAGELCFRAVIFNDIRDRVIGVVFTPVIDIHNNKKLK